MDRLERLKNKGLNEEEWQKSWNKYQQQYIRKRLQAIKCLHEGQSRKEVIVKVGCARESIATWLDMYDEEGLKGLTELVKRKKSQSLSKEQKTEIKVMLLEQKPTDYDIDRQIWTGKIIQEVIRQRWQVELKESRIYDILKVMGLSHQKSHRDYEYGDKEQQQK